MRWEYERSVTDNGKESHDYYLVFRVERYYPNTGGSGGKRKWNMKWRLGVCRGYGRLRTLRLARPLQPFKRRRVGVSILPSFGLRFLVEGLESFEEPTGHTSWCRRPNLVGPYPVARCNVLRRPQATCASSLPTSLQVHVYV